MVYSLFNASVVTTPPSAVFIPANKLRIPSQPFQEIFFPTVSCRRKSKLCKSLKNGQEFAYPTNLVQIMFQKSLIPIAASLAIVLWSNPACAGILSGFSGIESVPGPELPQIDFLQRFNEENQKRYAENDARFKESPLLKKLLERSRLNKEKNRQEILDKYCIRGAEWGVGDCSADAMSPDEREKFLAMLKQKAGVE